MGKEISTALIFFSGIVLMMGIGFYRREKSAGSMRLALLMYSTAACVWAFCYGRIGFADSVAQVESIRKVGALSVDVFLMIDFYIVSKIAQLNAKLVKIMNYIVAILLALDWVIFTQDGVDSFVKLDGYMTWIANDCIERNIHNTTVVLLVVTMAIMGVCGFKAYRYKRQKSFMVCFYIANLMLLGASSLDTFFVSGYALPTSGFGALICAVIIWIGTIRFSAFDVSVANLFEQIYDSINAGIFVFNDKREIVYANSYSKKITECQEHIGKHVTDVFDVTTQQADRFFEQISEENKDVIYLKTHNTGVECNGRLSAVIDRFHEPYCYILLVYDMTKELYMLEELQKANAAKDHFLVSMSHEIRTPINSVLGMNEMILRESKEQQTISYATNIQSATRLLLSLVNDVLDFSKIESGSMDLRMGVYDTSSMLNDLYVITSQQAKDKGLKLEVKVNPSVPSRMEGDEIRIKQIVVNILMNAVKYTDEGFVLWECDYEKVDDEHVNLIMSVRDSGRGMKNVDMAHLFSTFTRLDQVKNQTIEGTGLGLSITKSLLDLMDGDVQVESIYGVGSKFVVRIPQRIENSIPIGDFEKRVEQIKSSKTDYVQKFTAPNAKILAVDDVEMNLLVIKELLKETQAQVELVNGGEVALRRCKEQQYDIILMDHMMPDMDGISCMKYIKEECALNANTPIIVLTANAVAGMREMYLNEGFDDYISKPVEGKLLEKTIKAYLPENKILV